MLIYVEWKIDLSKNNKVNILRILMEKDPNIKYEISPRKFLLGNINIGIGEEFDQEKIYFSRVKIGSGNKIISGDTNEIQMFVIEIQKDTCKTLNVYIAGTKAALTSNIKDLFMINDKFHLEEEIFYDKLKELKKYGVINFTNLIGEEYVFRVGSVQIN